MHPLAIQRTIEFLHQLSQICGETTRLTIEIRGEEAHPICTLVAKNSIQSGTLPFHGFPGPENGGPALQGQHQAPPPEQMTQDLPLGPTPDPAS